MKVDYSYKELKKYAGCKCYIVLTRSKYKYKGMLYFDERTQEIYFFSNNPQFDGAFIKQCRDFDYRYSFWLTKSKGDKDGWLNCNLAGIYLTDADRDLGEL